MIEELKSVNKSAHSVLSHIVKRGDTVVDATCGNGYDTEFLARLVGEDGYVYAFDIQPTAIKNTTERLKRKSLDEQVTIIEDDHSRMHLYLEEPVNAFIFNLGYLPGSDHSTMTEAKTTIEALKQATEYLAPGGIITITVYSHPQGREEAAQLEEYLTNLSGDINTYSLKRLNRSDPPFLYIITKDQ